MTPDLALALALADEADAITLRHFRSSALAVRTKSDRTPVSAADEAVERMIREQLAAERPDDGVVGEELGAADIASERRWIIDPIDATKNYIRGIPVFATLIGFEDRGRLAAGVVSAPALGRRWWAARGEGAFCNGERMDGAPPERPYVVPSAIVRRCLNRRLTAVELFAGYPVYFQGALVPRRAFEAAGPFDPAAAILPRFNRS